ncbi:MAG: hypothetical protein ACQ9MH_05635 [Nitrospinales bacterium]
MEKLIALIRRPDGLKALVNTKKYDIGYWNLEDNKDKLNDFYETKEIPLESFKGDKCIDQKQLQKSWKYISKVNQWDEETLFHIFYLLVETDPAYDEVDEGHLPPLKFDPAPKPAKATAANPRGIRATKNKLVKTKKIQPINLQPYLCNRKNVKAITKKLLPYWPSGYARLAKAGYDVTDLPSNIKQLEPHLDPYFVVHHQLTKDIRNYKLPPQFVKHILPSLKGLEWKKVTEVLSIYWELSLANNIPLLTCVSRLLSLNITDTSLNICKLIASQQKDRRIDLAIYAIKRKAYLIPPENFDLHKGIGLLEITSTKHFSVRLKALFDFMYKGYSLDYLREGFCIANKFCPSFAFNNLENCYDFPYEKFHIVIERFQVFEDFSNWSVVSHWATCGRKNWYKNFIKKIDLNLFSPGVGKELIRVIRDHLDIDSSADKSGKRRIFIDQQVSRIIKYLKHIDKDYQFVFLESLGEFYNYWDKLDIPRKTAYLNACFEILERMCKKPFKQNINAIYLTSFFIDYSYRDNRSVFLHAPESSLLNLQKATRSRNSTNIMVTGMIAILWSFNKFTIQCFINYSSKLFKVAKCLGTATKFHVNAILKEFSRHPLMKPKVEDLKANQICPLVKSFLEPGITNPIPKKLNDYLQGKCDLTDTQIKNLVVKLKVALNSTRLDILEQMILDTLSKNLPISKEDENHMHTLQFLNVIEENRRPIKRFIKALHEGKSDYLETHPVTQKWITRHKIIPLKKWTSGFNFTGDTEKHGTVTITLEQNPMEVLKMGTYVGSCLGLGGDYSYNAAATVLDINKQVLYARNSENKVVGRQLIAISKKNDLVCFEVYPINVSLEVKDLFCEYDLMLADFLGLNLYEDSDKPVKPKKKKDGEFENYYEIENILSSEWYDDYAWDFK